MNNSIGERILYLRKQKGLTQFQLAKQLNISDKNVSKWESGKGYPSLQLIELLSNVLDCTTDYLIKGIDKNFYMIDKENFIKKCFELLQEKVGKDKYTKFCNTYKFIDIENKLFNFEMFDKEIYEELMNTDKYDDVFEELISISIQLNKDYNGYNIKLIDK